MQKFNIDKGASFAVVDNQKYCLNTKNILVDDVLCCLQELSKYHRKQLKCPVLGILALMEKLLPKN